MNELRKDMNKAIEERFGSEYGISDLKHTICMEVQRRKREQGASPFTTFMYESQSNQIGENKQINENNQNVIEANPFAGVNED